jgi:hypothetical protein
MCIEYRTQVKDSYVKGLFKGHTEWSMGKGGEGRGEGGGGCGVSANEYSCAHGAQINFEDLTIHMYLTCEKRG